MAKINQVAANLALPAGMSGMFVVAGLWVLTVVGISVAWSYTQIVALFVAIPVVMFASGTGYWYIIKCKQSKVCVYNHSGPCCFSYSIINRLIIIHNL